MTTEKQPGSTCLPAAQPRINTPCPACCSRGTLFVGEGGWLTCGLLGCPDPAAADAVLTKHADMRDDAQRHEAAARRLRAALATHTTTGRADQDV